MSRDLAHADRERDAVVVVQDGRIVGWGLIWDNRKRWADVHPDARGQGIGQWLLRWSAVARGGAGCRSDRTDDRRRPHRRRRVVRRPRLHAPLHVVDAAPRRRPRSTAPPSPRAPEEYDEVLALIESAFAEHPDRLARDRDSAGALRRCDRLGFQPEDLVVIRDAGRPVAAAFLIESDEIWVDKLAVAADPPRAAGTPAP